MEVTRRNSLKVSGAAALAGGLGVDSLARLAQAKPPKSYIPKKQLQSVLTAV